MTDRFRWICHNDDWSKLNGLIHAPVEELSMAPYQDESMVTEAFDNWLLTPWNYRQLFRKPREIISYYRQRFPETIVNCISDMMKSYHYDTGDKLELLFTFAKLRPRFLASLSEQQIDWIRFAAALTIIGRRDTEVT